MVAILIQVIVHRSEEHKMSPNPKLSRFNSENVSPNVQLDEQPSVVKESISASKTNQIEEVASPEDPHVKVIARIRPPNSHERGDYTVRKLSYDSVSVGDRKFTLDAVLDSKSSQEDAFQAVGVSMVKSAMAGYNTSILAYGQTGSGKTYTLWGPPSAMVEDQSASGNQGIVPRIFQMLFSEIQQVQDQAEGKQINYQCHCSFLEIYNEQIGDLLDPTQRNLETRPALPALQQLIHSNDEEVLTDACWALSYLSDGTDDKIQAVIESNVCPRLVELLNHPSPSVLIPALRTVGNIVIGDDMQTQIGGDSNEYTYVDFDDIREE